MSQQALIIDSVVALVLETRLGPRMQLAEILQTDFSVSTFLRVKSLERLLELMEKVLGTEKLEPRGIAVQIKQCPALCCFDQLSGYSCSLVAAIDCKHTDLSDLWLRILFAEDASNYLEVI